MRGVELGPISTREDARGVDRIMAASRARTPPPLVAPLKRPEVQAQPLRSVEAMRAVRQAQAPVQTVEGIRAHSIAARGHHSAYVRPTAEYAAAVSPTGGATALRSQSEIRAEVVAARAQFNQLSARYGRATAVEREGIRLAMDPLVKQENALRREFASARAAPAQQMSLSFGR